MNAGSGKRNERKKQNAFRTTLGDWVKPFLIPPETQIFIAASGTLECGESPHSKINATREDIC